jgi:RimJ/RimL family protein N-acetyltransferase
MKLASPFQPLPELKSSLYSPAEPNSRNEIVYARHFRYPACKISLRPFCIVCDMPVIYNWAWKESYAAELIAESYQYTHESNFARSYMALSNNSRPICEVDICHASQDELCDQFPVLEGDYVLRLLVPGKNKSRPLLSNVLQTCMEYFFRFPEVERILMEPDVENTDYNELLVRSGFCFQQTIYQLYKTSNLYYFTRQSFQQKTGA